METVKNYAVHSDSRKEITLYGEACQHHNAREYSNSCIILESGEYSVPDDITAGILRDMDRAMAAFGTGDVPDPVDLSDF